MRYDNEINITLKDLIGLVILVASILTIYYTSVNQIDRNKTHIELIQKDLDQVNMLELQKDIQYVRRDIDKLDVKMDRVLDKLLMDKGD